jgi:hypothetical protein
MDGEYDRASDGNRRDLACASLQLQSISAFQFSFLDICFGAKQVLLGH